MRGVGLWSIIIIGLFILRLYLSGVEDIINIIYKIFSYIYEEERFDKMSFMINFDYYTSINSIKNIEFWKTVNIFIKFVITLIFIYIFFFIFWIFNIFFKNKKLSEEYIYVKDNFLDFFKFLNKLSLIVLFIFIIFFYFNRSFIQIWIKTGVNVFFFLDIQSIDIHFFFISYVFLYLIFLFFSKDLSKYLDNPIFWFLIILYIFFFINFYMYGMNFLYILNNFYILIYFKNKIIIFYFFHKLFKFLCFTTIFIIFWRIFNELFNF